MTMRDAITAAERLKPDRRQQAIAYLRSRGIYCLDQPVQRIKPAEARTVLDKWIRGRR
jgi:hypothetical protein